MMTQRYQKLVDQFKNRIYSFAYYSLGNHEEAEDATQEVLLKIWKHGLQIEPPRMLAWVMQVARNTCIDALRKRVTYRTHVVVDSENDVITQTQSSAPNPAKLAEDGDFQVYLKDAIQQLEEPYRSILIMREIQELKHREISEALALPENTVKVYLHRAKRSVREKLKQVLHNENG